MKYKNDQLDEELDKCSSLEERRRCLLDFLQLQDYQQWAWRQYWTLHEATCLCLDVDPEKYVLDFGVRYGAALGVDVYKRSRDIQRALADMYIKSFMDLGLQPPKGIRGDTISDEVLEWVDRADRLGIEMPAKLLELVASYNETPTRKELLASLSEKTEECERLNEQQLDPLESSNEQGEENETAVEEELEDEPSDDLDESEGQPRKMLLAFDLRPLSGIAKVFPLDKDDERNIKKWRRLASDASRNGLAGARASKGGGSAESMFHLWLVAEWLIKRGDITTSRAYRKLGPELPARSAHLKDHLEYMALS